MNHGSAQAKGVANEEPRKKNGSQKKKNKEEAVARGPKDTKVVLIDQQLFSSLQETGKNKNVTEKKNVTSKHDFPSLIPSGSGLYSSTVPLSSPWGSGRISREPFPILTSLKGNVEQTPAKSVDQVKHIALKSDKSAITKEKVGPIEKTVNPNVVSSKKKKIRGPMVLDFSSLIKTQTVSNQHGKRGGKTRLKRLLHAEHLGGNILDSSKPIRSKGKFRENKKKTLSPLKKEILRERILRALSKSKSVEEEPMDLKKEIEIYLAKLKESRIDMKVSDGKAVQRPASKRIKSPDETVNVAKETGEPTITKIAFSSNFRDYCSNMLTAELDAAVKDLIQALVSLQDHAFDRDPLKARIRKRHVAGIREAGKYLKLKRVKLLIIAPDLETASPEGVINKTINCMKEQCSSIGIPCAFALNRRKLGHCTLKKSPVSAFAVLRYDSLESLFRIVVEQLEVARTAFKLRFPSPETEERDMGLPVSTILEKLRLDDGGPFQETSLPT